MGRAKSAAFERPAGAGLRKTLGATELLSFGISATLGAGIYSLVGAGANVAGAAVSLSFLLAAGACLLTGLVFAEFACRMPVAGSSYAYISGTLGETGAYLVGWNMTLECATRLVPSRPRARARRDTMSCAAQPRTK